MDRGALQAAVHGVAKSWTRLRLTHTFKDGGSGQSTRKMRCRQELEEVSHKHLLGVCKQLQK